MAAGLVTKVVGDGNGSTVSMRYWSPDTSASPQLLFPCPILFDSSGVEISFTATSPVYGPIQCVDVTPTLDTSAYTSGDILFTATAIAGAVRATDALGYAKSLMVTDKDDVGAAVDIYFWDANVTFGTINTAPTISDADADNLLGSVSIAAADWKDLGGVKVCAKSLDFVIKPASGGTTIYVTAVVGAGAGTQTASGYVLRFGSMS